MEKRAYTTAALVVILSVFTISAQAAPLGPGGAIPSSPEPDPLGGVVVASTNVLFTGLNLSGSLTSTVIAGDITNPFGGLTFTYQLFNSVAGVDSMGRLTVNGWDALPTDVSHQIPLAGLAPFAATRDANGNVVGFNFFGPELMPGMTSAVLVVQTSLPTFTDSFASVINGSVVSPIYTFAPVPEPTTIALVGLGLVGVLALRRRRR